MEIRQLQYFLAVARELNFTRAARTLHITVPPLTRQIQALEHELGQPLFDRSTHHVALTEAGVTLTALAAGIVADVEAVPARLTTRTTTDGVRISVPFALNRRVRNAFSDVLSRHSSAFVFAVSQVASKDVEKALHDNRVDIALTHVEPSRVATHFSAIDDEEIGVLVDATHFPADRTAVSAVELAGFSYVHGPQSWEIAEMLQAQRDLFAAGVANPADERYLDLSAMLIALDGARKLTLRSTASGELDGMRESKFRVMRVSDLSLRFTTYLAWRAGEPGPAGLHAELVRDLRADT